MINPIWDEDIYNAMCGLVLFGQFKRREKAPIKECYFQKSCRHTSLRVFFTFFNCMNCIKLRKKKNILNESNYE